MSEPPAAPCAVRGLRWGRITDMVCLQHMLLYSLWMGEAHTPLACVAHALAQWHTNERVPFLLQRLCTPTQLRAKYQGSAHERIMTLLQNENTDITDNEEEKAMRAAVQQGPLAQVASDEAGREGHVRAFLAAMYRREYVEATDAVWKCISYCYVPCGLMCLSIAHRSRRASIPTIPKANRSARPLAPNDGKDSLRRLRGMRFHPLRPLRR